MRPGDPRPASAGAPPERPDGGSWTFLTNHGHALVALARDGDLRIRDLATALGVTERTAQTIVNDLVAAGYVERTRVGTRSRYAVQLDLPFRHAVEREHSVGELLAVLQRDAPKP
jgi:DNA-binding MarR family transcriptional regulator